MLMDSFRFLDLLSVIDWPWGSLHPAIKKPEILYLFPRTGALPWTLKVARQAASIMAKAKKMAPSPYSDSKGATAVTKT